MISGKKLIMWYGGFLGAIALGGFCVVLWIRTLPVAERQQRFFSARLVLAYQKYRFDVKEWPTSPQAAAANFKSENEGFLDETSKAEKEWGLKVKLIEPDSPQPMLELTYDKPQFASSKHALKPKK
ncbi:MAG: hypothetical protein ABL949_09130 [Fimbriimonadaceae bacterium]